ncbi:hypothetical protein STRA110950_06050 [Streptobacillus ratti]|uniref:hypothetical protein n=2 Tax=Streptobacillus ratti TaxID=1720557 RepID=UPI0039EB6B17
MDIYFWNLGKEELIKKELTDFYKLGYNLSILAKICAEESCSMLGRYLAKYWNNGEWDYQTFKNLLTTQTSKIIALDYLENFSKEKYIEYKSIIEDLINNNYSKDILVGVYRVEALTTKEIPKITNASEQIKSLFWVNYINCDISNDSWVLIECKKYATLEVYLEQIYQIHSRRPLTAEKIFECFDDIEKMHHSIFNQMIGYYVEQLINVIQEEYIDNLDKCYRISKIELFFMKLLDWRKMKCFNRVIKHSPEILAELVSIIFKKDNEDKPEEKTQIYNNMYEIYMKAHFCPAELNGKVNEENLEYWIEQYKKLLIENDQESLFTSTLGRVLSFSPLGDDGYEPCDAVRKMIEKYGDDKMIRSYKNALFNRRGVFSPSAGKEELIIAEKFKMNAEFLEPKYPKTAQIFHELFEEYSLEAKQERMRAENGW